MKFVDQVSVHVKAGDGGNGAIAFRREKYIDRGGPNGGDGGNGGSVIFRADPQLTTLLDYRYQPIHKARNGQGGMGNDCNGRAADDLLLRVPVGTLVKDAATGEVLVDFSEPNQEVVLAKGGRGGLGNMNFATSTRQTPRFAQDGTPGEEKDLVLELKLLADVGLLGFPNAGKSTLISRISRARPKIADYPFTTLVPNLGMVQYKDGQSFVVADIPGLIEGASEGHGLGHQFLRHVERCRVLIHVVDLSAEGEGRAPLQDWQIINRELVRYSKVLAEKPQVVAANKIDLPDAQAKLGKFREALAKKGVPVFPISSATGEGVQALLDVVARVLYGGVDQLPTVAGEERPHRRAKTTSGSTKKADASAAPKAKRGGAQRVASARKADPKAAKKAERAARKGKRGAGKVKQATGNVMQVAESEAATGTSAAETPAAKRPAAKKPAAKKAAANKPAAKKPAAKKIAANKAAAKKPAAKKAAAKKPAAKKPAAKNAAAKKPAAKRTAARAEKR
jgi:GTP-binding protein